MYGPLSFLVTNAYDPALYDWMVVLRVLQHGSLALALALLWQPLERRWLWLLAPLALLPLPFIEDYQGLLLPSMAVLLRAARRGPWLWPLLVILAAVFGWAKFSILLAAGLLLPLGDLLLAWRCRRLPLMTPLLLLTGLATHLAAGQPLAALPDFLRTSVQVAVGYTMDESRTGPLGWSPAWSSLERLGFLTLALALAGTVAWGLLRSHRLAPSGARGAIPGLVLMPILITAAFLSWKAGFVRHDAHALTAWAGLALLSVALVPVVERGRICLISIVLLATAAHWVSAVHQKGFGDDLLRTTLLRRPLWQATAAWSYLTDHEARLAAFDRQQAASWAEIRQQFPLPPLAGSVDIVPWPGAMVVAAGLDYRPRPAPGYIATTTALRQLNLDHFTGPNRPDWVLWQLNNFDNHYPLLDEAHLLPTLLTSYDWVDNVSGFQLLRHRDTPRTLDLLELPDLLLPANEWVVLPQEPGPLWARLELPITFWGQVQTALWRPPLLALGVELTDGTRQLFPLPLLTATDGFLLTPLLSGRLELTGLLRWLDDGEFANQRIARLRLVTDQSAAGHAYEWPARLRLARMTVAGPREYPLSPKLVRSGLLAELLASYRVGDSDLPPALDDEGLLWAHPPLRLSLSAARARAAAGVAGSLQVNFGIRDTAWQAEPNTNGVCFRVIALIGGTGETLFERCLDPFRQTADRGPQQATVMLPAAPFDRLAFDTDPRGDRYRDWAYWSLTAVE